MPTSFTIPSTDGAVKIELQAGNSLFFVGANGTGKTRLATLIEDHLELNAHRISAHRALGLRPAVPKISEDAALRHLRTGTPGEGANAGNRRGSRYRGHPATGLLDDFDQLIQALFAEQSKKSLDTHNRLRAGEQFKPEPTKFEHLVEIWERLLPHRKLHISGDDIRVSVAGAPEQYSASEMSDGERAVFYLVGQALIAATDSVLIVDEPELHIHPSIVSGLWDELESARQDCGFIFISHDLQFASQRVGRKFVLRSYNPKPEWAIEEIPENTGFDEELATFILGSRKPVLFVEGDENSLDASIYRHCYPSWTIISCGSCESVVHSVITMRKHPSLTRITCAGIVDADHRSADEVKYLAAHGISTLPVAEIENLVLLPSISEAIARAEGFAGSDLDETLADLKAEVFASVTPNAKQAAVARFVRRRVDHFMKKVDLSQAKAVADIQSEFESAVSALDIAAIAAAATKRIEDAVAADNLVTLLECYDDKSMFALAAKHLRATKPKPFQSWLTRNLRNKKLPGVLKAVKNSVPSVVAK